MPNDTPRSAQRSSPAPIELFKDGRSLPNAARFWNAAGGGRDAFHIDRELFYDLDAKVQDLISRERKARTLSDASFAALVDANRQFVHRASAYLAGQLGIDQYIDLGVGLPVDDHIHRIVQSINPDAKVLYVDNDPMAVRKAQGLFESSNSHIRVVDADIFAPKELLHHKEVASFLDWSKPVAIFATATLHEHPDGTTEQLAEIMRTYIDHASPDSCTVISHFFDPELPDWNDAIQTIQNELHSGLGRGTFRTRAEIEALFPNQRLLAPGVVPCLHWPTSADDQTIWIQTCIAGGVGQKCPPPI